MIKCQIQPRTGGGGTHWQCQGRGLEDTRKKERIKMESAWMHRIIPPLTQNNWCLKLILIVRFKYYWKTCKILQSYIQMQFQGTMDYCLNSYFSAKADSKKVTHIFHRRSTKGMAVKLKHKRNQVLPFLTSQFGQFSIMKHRPNWCIEIKTCQYIFFIALMQN